MPLLFCTSVLDIDMDIQLVFGSRHVPFLRRASAQVHSSIMLALHHRHAGIMSAVLKTMEMLNVPTFLLNASSCKYACTAASSLPKIFSQMLLKPFFTCTPLHSREHKIDAGLHCMLIRLYTASTDHSQPFNMLHLYAPTIVKLPNHMAHPLEG